MNDNNNNTFNSFNKLVINPEIKQLLNELKEDYQNNGKVTERMIEKMQQLRKMYIDLSLPTVVKSIRLVYEYIQKNESFSIKTWEEEDEQVSSFEYFLDLLSNPTNKYNRDEIKELNVFLKQGAVEE